jgi:hypothetical protein
MPAEKLILNMLKIIKVRSTYFKIYLEIRCQNEALYFNFLFEASYVNKNIPFFSEPKAFNLL